MKTSAPRLAVVDEQHAPPRFVDGQGIVFSKRFHYPRCAISLRPFCVASDLPGLYNRRPATHEVSELIAASYQYTRESSFARSYMVLFNQDAIYEADICHACQDELCEHYRAEAGDYMLRLIPVSQGKISRPVFSNMIKTCLEYFFRFPEVKRIFTECECEDIWHQKSLLKNGFRLKGMINREYKDSNLYCYALSQWRKRSRSGRRPLPARF